MSEPRPDPTGDPAGGPADGRPAWQRFLPAAVLIAGLAAFFALGGYRYVSFEALEEHREALKALVAENATLAVLGFIAVYTVMAAFSIPGALVMTVAGGFLFGILLGAFCSVVGATLGGTAVFLAARSALGDVLRQRAGNAVKRMREGFQEDAFSYLLVLRLIPIVPFWLVNLVPAFLGVSLKVFVAGTLLGIIPGSLVYASVGNGLGAIFEAGDTASIRDAIFAPEVLLPIVALIALSLLPVIYKKMTHRNVRRGKNGDSGAS